jgi:non-specific serine/threonine protein kinase/serine/threonine-protein kinase
MVAGAPERTPPAQAAAGDVMPERIGPYRLLGLLGEGGMGAVFLAEQSAPVERQVAIKLIKAPFASRATLLRFEAERRALARLSHPCVAQLFEAGTTEQGLPYFVMERVVGARLTDYCDARRLGVRARLELFLAVCDGVRHAHQKGLIHRDLKPGNILVTEIDGKPVPKVIDFGIAKAIDQPLSEANLTVGAQVLGTPAYLSPEALAGLSNEEVDLDTRADVYALGLILFELLVGVLPFPTSKQALADLARRLLDEESKALGPRYLELGPSACGEIAEARGTTPEALRRTVAGDLEWVVARATARDRDQRYGSVGELAAELGRYLRQEPVEAGPPSRLYRLRKLVRRRRLEVAAGALLLLSLLGGLVARGVEAARANREAAAARQAQDEAEQVAAFLTDLFEVSGPLRSRGATITARELLDRGAVKVNAGLDKAPQTKARMLQTIGRVYANLGLFDAALPLARAAAEMRTGDPQSPPAATARSLHLVGEILLQKSERSGSLAALRQALAVAESTGREDGTTFEILDDLGSIYRLKGWPLLALATHRRALAIAQGPYGTPSLEARALYSLAYVAFEGRDYLRGEDWFRRSIAIREGLDGPESPLLAGALRGLADLLDDEGRFAESGPLYLRALAITEKVYGPKHPNLAMILNNLGVEYWAQQRLDEAAAVWERALAIDEAVYGPDNIETGYPVLNLGLVAAKKGDLAQAKARLRRAQAIFVPKVGPNDQVLGWLDWGLGLVARAEGRYDDACRLFARALASRVATLPAGHRDLLETARDYAAALRAVGRDAEALAIDAQHASTPVVG